MRRYLNYLTLVIVGLVCWVVGSVGARLAHDAFGLYGDLVAVALGAAGLAGLLTWLEEE